MRLVVDVLIPTEEDGVEQGGGELTDSTTDGRNELAAQDHRRLYEPVFLSSDADVLVEREFVAGHHDRSRREVGHALDVCYPGLATWVEGGEF